MNRILVYFPKPSPNQFFWLLTEVKSRCLLGPIGQCTSLPCSLSLHWNIPLQPQHKQICSHVCVHACAPTHTHGLKASFSFSRSLPECLVRPYLTLWQKAKGSWRASWWKWRGMWTSWLKTQHSEIWRSWHPVPSFYGRYLGKQWKQWQTVFLGSKITADGDCSHEIKRCWFLGRKAVTSLDSVFKSRDVTLQTKVHLVKAMVFPVVMYRCWELDNKESWVPKNWCF